MTTAVVMADKQKKPVGRSLLLQTCGVNFHNILNYIALYFSFAEMQKTDSAVMRSIDAADAGIGGKKQKYDFPDTLEGFKYAFNDSTIYPDFIYRITLKQASSA